MRYDQGRLFRSLKEVEDMTGSYMVLKSLLRTEKGAIQALKQQYLFAVKKDANKIEIKKAVEGIYKVKVKAVNTHLMPGKLKRVRSQQGKTPDWKKAIVTLQAGHKIDLA
jgi:large subunit ribosomal protein L23